MATDPQASAKQNNSAEILSFMKLPQSAHDIHLKCGRPVEKLSVVTWEQAMLNVIFWKFDARIVAHTLLYTTLIIFCKRHSLHLPDDLKNFYYAFDGVTCHLLLKENNSSVSGASAATSNPCPSFSINSISSLLRIGNFAGPNGSAMCSAQGLSSLWVLDAGDDATYPMKPRFGSDLKAFELSRYRDGKYCLVYHHTHHRQTPNVWFLDRALDWHYVAPDFISFFRHRLHSLYTSLGETPNYY